MRADACDACFVVRDAVKGTGGSVCRRGRLGGRDIAAFIASLTNDERDDMFYGGRVRVVVVVLQIRVRAGS